MANLRPWQETKEQPLTRLRGEFEEMFDRFLSRWPAPIDTEYGLDRLWGLEVEDRHDEILLRADVPGFEPDELDVQLDGRLLTIKAEKKPDGQQAGNGARGHRSFYRRVRLPEWIETGAIEAHYHNGVLEVRLPRSEKSKPRRIPVRA